MSLVRDLYNAHLHQCSGHLFTLFRFPTGGDGGDFSDGYPPVRLGALSPPSGRYGAEGTANWSPSHPALPLLALDTGKSNILCLVKVIS